jgi:hypothetical protein
VAAAVLLVRRHLARRADHAFFRDRRALLGDRPGVTILVQVRGQLHVVSAQIIQSP